MDIVLEPVEARVLGSLLEKERTVPATYPLTMSALLTACNQATSRDPVMELDEARVEAAVESLKAMKLVRRVLPSHGSRVVKYRQVADEVLALDSAQRAVVTLLLLRGPQTPMELRARSERIHTFADADAVERTLTEMASWGDPLVRLLPRRPGQREARWAHLLSGEPSTDGSASPGPAALAESAPGVGPGHQPDNPLTGAGPGHRPTDTMSATSAAGASATSHVETGLDGGPAFSSSPAGPPGPSSPGPDPRTPSPPRPDPAVHGSLAALAGTWIGPGQGRYPTVEDFAYAEQVEIVPVPGKPILSYRSTSRSPDGSKALHAESGFLRLAADGSVELVVAAGPGIVEACSGLVEDEGGVVEVVLASDVVAGTLTAVEVTSTERTYRVEGDTLTYEIAMSAVGQPAAPHLQAVLART